MRAPALASPEEQSFEGKAYARAAGPFSAMGSTELPLWNTFVLAESFVVEVTLPTGPGGNLVSVRQSIRDGLSPEADSVVATNAGC